MPRDAVSRTANIGTVGTNGLTLDGNTMTHQQTANKDKKEKATTIIRIFDDAGFLMDCIAENFVAKRVYRRLQTNITNLKI